MQMDPEIGFAPSRRSVCVRRNGSRCSLTVIPKTRRPRRGIDRESCEALLVTAKQIAAQRTSRRLADCVDGVSRNPAAVKRVHSGSRQEKSFLLLNITAFPSSAVKKEKAEASANPSADSHLHFVLPMRRESVASRNSHNELGRTMSFFARRRVSRARPILGSTEEFSPLCGPRIWTSREKARRLLASRQMQTRKEERLETSLVCGAVRRSPPVSASVCTSTTAAKRRSARSRNAIFAPNKNKTDLDESENMEWLHPVTRGTIRVTARRKQRTLMLLL